MKRLICLFLALAGLFTFCVCAAEDTEPFAWESVYTFAAPESANSRIEMQEIDGASYLFLPEGCNVEALPLYFKCTQETELFSLRGSVKADGVVNGEAVNLKEFCGEQTVYEVTLQAQYNGLTAVLSLTVVPSRGVASLFLVSDDPVNHGREWVEDSPDKSNKATGSMLMRSPDGSTIYDGALTQIKGRGNSTWLADKKPYQIKLKEKTDLLQTGDSDNAAKTWVLLTNASDETSLRNQLVYDLSVAMGMEPGIQCTPVNLFYDGEYRGAYLLCEKVEVTRGRVDISNLEEENENSNPDTELDTLEVATGKTENGAAYTYCAGMQEPEDISGGYLLEMDTPERAQAEVCYFVTTRNHYIVVKSPEFCSRREMDYIASYYQELEDTIYHQGTHPTNGKTLADYASVESIAQCYLINELTKNPDGYSTSTYLYKDAGSDIMTFGPIWDYDLSFGHSFGEYVQAAADPEGYFTLYMNFAQALYQIPQFRQAVHDVYLEQIAPLLTDVLLGHSAEAAPLKSFSAYEAQLRESARANGILWHISDEMWTEGCRLLRTYITQRNDWLTAVFADWSSENCPVLAPYVDVQPEQWFYENVFKATEYGILNGMSNGIFAPEGHTTRAQATKVLFAIAGDTAPEYTPAFSDVAEGQWYTPAILWAKEHNVVNGYDDGTFGPEDPVTRQDMVVILHRFLQSPAATGNILDEFADSALVADYAREAMQWALDSGILRGYEDNTVRPEDTITRAELASVIVRFYESFIKES